MFLPGTLTLIKQVRDANYGRMQARVREIEAELAQSERDSASIGKQLAALKVRHAILESECDGMVQIARTLTAQLVGANIKPAQDIESYLRYQHVKEVEHGATD